MAFDPQDFAEVATFLAIPGARESHLRTAIGRLYYSLFLKLKERLRNSIGGRQARKTPHKAVIKALGEQNTSAADGLRRLMILREQADYFLVPSKPEFTDWSENWKLASSLFTDVSGQIQQLRSR